ncbi:MAG: hypothetical protein COX37_01750 [Candidatus Nealsonbacteria bacterium CG23_combo_of_CG06-09_8_20_14_all_39_17]|uniref:Solute-binding protein family 5 domain-containing protein n=1 Tax=Candidatus Nealsonbacteria bacterium CG23_combo_of_CG06-09_8_20_14_all_39_17 TaxID=1974722 RepID=A0A2G9YUE7_9BACT|nr:MAG: hypothetical protein COX37_01750 [Candidatus Nealsonbacteria bacterium CG23_combo_of_CG06-09_8_20_14_all_39_17]PIU43849.1 MAG: hypothetical protein COS96_02200 [Candidatus Nealsonbacteria bacterium CG07_land_8_20_14_0_80_39_13]
MFIKYKFPSKKQLGQLFKVLSLKEASAFLVFVFMFLGGLFLLATSLYFQYTKIVPAKGGAYAEGVVGFPRWINPIFSPSNSADQDLTELIFSGLMKYDSEGKIVPDLAEKYEVFEDGKVWDFTIKENVLWHDGQPLNIDDVIFTLKTIQDSEVKSPLRPNWLGVEIERVSDYKVRFTLKNPSSVFLENCVLKIMPKHIWEKIMPKNFSLADLNLQPTGTGPYKLKKSFKTAEGKITSLNLIENTQYYGQKPSIPEISFFFFDSEEAMVLAFENKQIQGFSLPPDSPLFSENLAKNQSIEILSFSLPRYFAIFLNPKISKVLEEKEVRQALNYGTDKKEILEKVLNGRGKIVLSPVLPDIYKFNEPKESYQFDKAKAEELLAKAGLTRNESGIMERVIKKTPASQFKKDIKPGDNSSDVKELQQCLAKDTAIYPSGSVTGYFGQSTKEAVMKFQEKYRTEILDPAGLKNGTGTVLSSTRKKLNEICFGAPEEKISLEFSLTIVDQPASLKTAELIKKQWQDIGVKVEIEKFDVSTLEKNAIKPRNFSSLLFGEVLGSSPDLFPFWHSSQKKDPGLNLANYENKASDKLMEEIRQTLDENTRKEKTEMFQNLLMEDAPAIFLYNPDYLYIISKEVKGIKTGMITLPSERFSGISNWYIKTKRIFKPSNI